MKKIIFQTPINKDTELIHILRNKTMPLSRPDTVPGVINYIWNTNPQSLLNIGMGFGGYGVLFRQTMDVRWGRVTPQQWQTRIDGIELNPYYATEVWKVYDQNYIGDVRKLLPVMGDYDVIFFGDVLEHLEKEDALSVIELAKTKAKHILITTPQGFASNEAEAERFNNPNEEHKCLLEESDLPGFTKETYGNQALFIWS